MKKSNSTFLSRILGFGATALLATTAPALAVVRIDFSQPNTWTNGSGTPIWSVQGFGFTSNWSYFRSPISTDDVLFPNIVPVFSGDFKAPPPLNTLTDGHTILVTNIVIDPNSLTFQNNYTLIKASTFAPGLFPAGANPVIPLTSGKVTVGAGFTAVFDNVDLQATNGTLIKLGGGTLRLNDTVFGDILVQEGLLGGNFTSTGSLTNQGTLSPGNSPGTMTIHGNYQQGKGANLNLEIASATLYDQLVVGRNASLGGNANVTLLDGYLPKRGQKFTVLSAGSISGRFDMVNSPIWDLLTLRAFYTDNTVTLEAVINSFDALSGLTRNQHAVAQNLDAVLTDPRESKLIEYLYTRDFNQLPGDFDKIAPEELTSIFTIGVSLANVQSQNIQRRTDDIRSGSGGFSAAGLALNGSGPSYSGSFGITTGVAGPTGDDGKESKEVKAVVPAEARWGTFLSGTGEWVSVGNTDNARGYNLESGGFTLGIDYKVTPNFAIGLAAGYTGTTADLVDRGRVYVNGGKIGLYATFFQNEQAAQAPTMSKDSSKEAPAPAPSIAKGFYADMAVFGGYNSYDTRRSALQGEARGDTDGGELNALFGAGYDFKAGGLTFGPTASFNYTYIGTNGFTEHGSLAPLNIHGAKEESLRTAFGLKASYDWKVGGILIKPEIRAAWQHEYGDTAYSLDSSFANGAGGTFTVAGPEIGRDSVLLGAGFAIQCSERFSTYFYYDGELGRRNYESNAVTGGIRIAF